MNLKVLYKREPEASNQRWKRDEAEVRVMPLLEEHHELGHAGELWKLETAKKSFSSNLLCRNAAFQKPSF